MKINNLSYFNIEDFFTAGEMLFKSLDIPLNPESRQAIEPQNLLGNFYKQNDSVFKAIKEVYFFGEVDDQIFNNSHEANSFINTPKTKNNEILIFGIKLNWNNQRMPSRTNLLKIVRAFNRISASRPVIILLQYSNYISLATNERTSFKIKKTGEKIGRLFILKDIDTRENKTHSAHLRILNELSIWKSEQEEVALFTNYTQLFEHWQKVFDIEELNNRFYKEIANWYFWAVDNVKFPTDIYKDKENPQQEANQIAVMRMLTRIIFVWFIKEKNLVDNKLFDENHLKNEVLNYIDKNDSTYYKAILQNLFFATLNTEMNSKQRTFSKQDPSTYFEPRYRYKKYFKKPEETKNEVFAISPFLNGGLFDSLDKKPLNKKEIRVDWFSDNKKNSLEVPDYLFFSEKTDQSELLNKTYQTKRNTYFVKGLINILESYKFTIEENTPLEIEVALDPELLGKVFENLLAYHNPETGKTARKKTGSFYTPRQIVEYMTDESLKAYLQTNLKDFENLTDLDDKLNELISYHTEENPFSQKETIALIQAIDKMKILDPACGSGAFPMGMLQKLIWVLHKIDPDNKHWKNQQKERVIGEELNKLLEDKEAVKNLNDKEVKQKATETANKRIKEIEDDFNKKYSNNYYRKLYLIQNSIFGIDIQTIAVQISKLRFFLSLIIEQKVNWNNKKENYDLKPMPNLETKFVAANTLIGIEKPNQYIIQNTEIEKLENELTEVRKKHFTAQNRKQKREIQKEDEKLRTKISELLVKDGWKRGVALKLAKWNPYNQNISADFFDVEWMFGIKNKPESSEIVFFNQQIIATNKQIIAINTALNQSQIEQIIKLQLKTTGIQIKIIKKGIQIIKKKIDLIYGTVNNKIDNIVSEPKNFDYEISGLNQKIKQTNKQIFEIAEKLKITNKNKSGYFDIVIGNPPYVRADSGIEHLNFRDKLLASKKYKTLWEKWDLYVAFMEKGFSLLNKNGNITYIIPSAYLTAKYALKSRNYFIDNSKIDRIDFLSDLDIFEAMVKNIIFQYENSDFSKHKPKRLKHKEKFGDVEILETKLQTNLKNNVFNEIIKKDFKFKNTIQWENIFYLSVGLVLNADEKKAKGKFKKADLISETINKINSAPYIEGKNIKAYKIEKIRYLEWDTKRCPALTRRPTFPELYIYPKIVIGRMTDAIYDTTGLISNDSTFISTFWENIKEVQNRSVNNSVAKDFKVSGKLETAQKRLELNKISKNYDIKYCLSILNSNFAKWFFTQVRRSAIGLYPNDIKQLPIKTISKSAQVPFITIVDYILHLKKQDEHLQSHYFEQIIDGMVYELYFEDELKTANKDILQFLQELPAITKKMSLPKKDELINGVFEEMYEAEHPVRKRLYYMDSIPEIRIIEGKEVH